MKVTVLHGARGVRYEEVAEPTIVKPTDAIIRLSANCICGSDLWPYRGINAVNAPMAMGHEYCGVVVEVGSEVNTVTPGRFVVGSFCLSDNTCPHCLFGFQSSCVQREFMTGGTGSTGSRCIGTQESMTQAIQCARPGSMIGYVRVPQRGQPRRTAIKTMLLV